MATAEPDSAIPGAEEVPEVDLAAKIIKQVEFYFGDKNLPRDKFLLRILHEEGTYNLPWTHHFVLRFRCMIHGPTIQYTFASAY